MTSEERGIVQELVVTPQHREPMSKTDFLRRFPTAVEHDRLATALLEKSERERSAEDLQCSLIVGFAFGFDPRQKPILCRLLGADWHFCHEDLVAALQEVRITDRETIDSLYKVTQWIPTYLAYDEGRALATKAVWALGKIPGGESEAVLHRLATSGDSLLRDAAQQQLQRRKV